MAQRRTIEPTGGSDKRRPSETSTGASMSVRFNAVVLLLVLALFGWVFSPAYGVLFLLLAVLAYYYTRPRCPSCGARGTTKLSGTEVIKQERAFGIITRKETVTKKKTDASGQAVNEDIVRKREERAPVLRTTTRYNYACSRCGRATFKDVVTQAEDFSRTEEPPPGQTVIIQKEIVKVPCKFCGTLNEIATAKTCSNCGAALK